MRRVGDWYGLLLHIPVLSELFGHGAVFHKVSRAFANVALLAWASLTIPGSTCPGWTDVSKLASVAPFAVACLEVSADRLGLDGLRAIVGTSHVRDCSALFRGSSPVYASWHAGVRLYSRKEKCGYVLP